MLATKKLPSVIIETHPVLSAACLNGQNHRPRIESKIAAEGHRFCRGIPGIGNDPGVPVAQAMNSIVDPPGEAAKHTLGFKPLGAISPTGEHDLFLVSDPIIVCILEVDQIR